MRVRKQPFRVDQDAQRFMRDRAPGYSPPIASRLVQLIRRRLSEGVAQGERLSDMTARVRKILGGSEGVVRASRIVRTEVVGAFNAGTVQNYIANSDVVEQKEWLTARDANVRPTQAGDFDHQTADTQRVPVRDPFIVSGERLMHPGDPAGSPGNIINCRCTVTPVTSRTPPAGRVAPGAALPVGTAAVVAPRGPRRTTRPRARTVRPERGPACKVCGDIHDTIKKVRRCPVKTKPRADRPGRRKKPRRGGPSAATQPAGALSERAMDAEPRSIPKDAKVGQFHSPEGKKVKPGEFFRGQPSAVIRPSKNGMIMWTPTRSAAEFHRQGAILAGKDGRLVSANLKFKNALRVTPEFFDDLSVASKKVIDDIKRQGFDAIFTDVQGSVGVAVFDIRQVQNVSIRFDGKRRPRIPVLGGRKPRRRAPRGRKKPRPRRKAPPRRRPSSGAIDAIAAGEFEDKWVKEFEAAEAPNIRIQDRVDVRKASLARISKKLNGVPGVNALLVELEASNMDDVVNLFSDAWANTSGDSKTFSIAFQLAAQEEFGLKTAAVSQFGKKQLAAARTLLKKHNKILKRMSREIYNDTQAWLKRNGIKEVTLYRGTSKRAVPFATSTGAVGETKLAPLSSFSSNTDDAGRFVDSFGRKATGPSIAGTKVPASEIFSTPVQGFGVVPESEIVMLGGDRTVVAATINITETIEDQIDELRQILAQAGGGRGDF